MQSSQSFSLAQENIDFSKKIAEIIELIDFSNNKKAIGELYTKISIANINNFIQLVLFFEELAKINAKTALIGIDQFLAKEILKINKMEFNKNKTYAVLCSEPGGNGTIENISTTANGMTIEGVKLISKEQAQADILLVFANDEDGKVSVYEMANDFELNSLEKNLSGALINLSQAKINAHAKKKIATISRGYEEIQTKIRTLIAAVAVGIAHSSLVNSIDTVKTVQNADGQALSANQSVQFNLVDMFVELEASRALTYLSADNIDCNKSNIKHATMAKVQASNTAAKLSTDVLELLGNFGYVHNKSQNFCFCDIIESAAATQIRGGTNRSQKNQIYKHILAKK